MTNANKEGHATVTELRAMAKKMRKKAPPKVIYDASSVLTGYWRGIRDAAAMLERRANRLDAQPCTHRRPRSYYEVTHCKRCGKLIEV